MLIFGSALLTIIAAIVVILLLFKITYYTVKRVVIHLVTGYIVYLIAVYLLHLPMTLGIGMWCLMALFGPIPVIIYGIYLLFV